jgi:hypothetical protein
VVGVRADFACSGFAVTMRFGCYANMSPPTKEKSIGQLCSPNLRSCWLISMLLRKLRVPLVRPLVSLPSPSLMMKGTVGTEGDS